jgi:hypothetical protein
VTTSGRTDRNGRLLENRSGTWGSSSADFMRIVRLLFAQSKTHAAQIDGNCSPYTMAGIPMLLSSLRCLVVEYASYPPTDSAMLGALTEANDFAKILERNCVDEPLRSEALLLQELRNEIIHPAHRPCGTQDNWADYLRTLKKNSLLQSTGREFDSSYFHRPHSSSPERNSMALRQRTTPSSPRDPERL